MQLTPRRLTELAHLVDTVGADLSAPPALEVLPEMGEALQRVESLSTLLGDVARSIRESLPPEAADPDQLRSAWLAQSALVPLARATERTTWVCTNVAHLASVDGLAPQQRTYAQQEAADLQRQAAEALGRAATELRSRARELAAAPAPRPPAAAPAQGTVQAGPPRAACDAGRGR